MSSPTLAGFLARTHPPLADRPDGELVREYADTGSEAAFAELARRFAPMVWGVCRRTVGHRQHAEDAFQAAFVVLARKAGSIRPPGAVGGWLHAVAVHTSLRARTLADRRRRRHRPLTSDPPAPMPPEPTDPDTLRALDEEIARLPDAQRAAVALCELGGVSRAEAAKRLGIAEGTLSSRLAAARKTLAARLRGRGVALAAALAALPATADAVPPVAAAASDTVSSLADGAIRAMLLNTLKRTLLIAVTGVALALAGGWLLLPAPAKDPPQLMLKAAKPQPKPKEGLIAFTTSDKDYTPLVLVVKPDGEEVARIEGFQKGDSPSGVHLSHDGKRLVFFIAHPSKALMPGGTTDIRGELQVYDLDSPGKPAATIGKDLRNASGLWGPDRKTLYVNELVDRKDAKEGEWAFAWKVTKYDVATGKGTLVELPADHRVEDVSRDGQTLLVSHIARTEDNGYHHEAYVADADTLKLKRVSQASMNLYRLSPDGTKAFGMKLMGTTPPVEQVPIVFDLKEGTETAVKFDDDTVHPPMAVWSPDGAKLLVYRTVVDGVKNEKPKVVGNVAYLPKNKQEVTIREPDGSKPKAVLEAYTFGPWFDWR